MQQWVEAILQASTWDAVKHIIERHPELLSDEADEMLRRFAAAPENAAMHHFVQTCRGLLQRCRDAGIALAFHDLDLHLLDERIAELRQRMATAPSSAPGRGDMLNLLGMGLHYRYTFRQEPEDLEHAIHALQEAVAMTPPGSADHTVRLRNLATVLKEHFNQDANSPHLDAAIDVLGQMLSDAGLDPAEQSLLASNLAECLHARFERQGDFRDLDAAIAMCEQVMAAADASAEKAFCLQILSNGLWTRYSYRNKLEDLDAFVRVCRQGAAFFPSDSEQGIHYRYNLAAALYKRYLAVQQVGNGKALPDLETAIAAIEQALMAIPPDSPMRPSCHRYLGECLMARHEHVGNPRDVEDAIATLQQALSSTAIEEQEYVSSLACLASACRARFDRSQAMEDLNAAIAALDRAQASACLDAQTHAKYLSLLSEHLRVRFELDASPENVDAFIAKAREAVAATPEGTDPDLLFIRLLYVIGGLAYRIEHGGNLDDLQEAIDTCRRATALPRSDPASLASCFNNLGNFLRKRYTLMGGLDDLDAAIKAFQQAVALARRDDPSLSAHLASLGAGLSDRYIHRGDTVDVNAAVAAFQQALDVSPQDSPSRAHYLSQLGAMLSRRAERGIHADLDLAIEATRKAVDLAPHGSRDRSANLINLASCLRQAFVLHGRPADMDDAIQASRQAIEASTPEEPDRPAYFASLGESLRCRYEHSGQPEDLAEAQASYREACRLGLAAHPRMVLASADKWGDWALHRGAWTEAVTAYGYGHQAVERLLDMQLLRQHKQDWLRVTRGMASSHAYALARCGELERAVEILEASRARLLAETLELYRRDLEQLPDDLYLRYQNVANRRAELLRPAERVASGTPADDTAQRRAIAETLEEFNAIVDAIRRIPGYEGFLRELSFADIQAMAPGSIIVYLLTTPVGGLALVVRGLETRHADNAAAQAVWLDTLSDAAVHFQLTGPPPQPQSTHGVSTYQIFFSNENRPRDEAIETHWVHDLDPDTVSAAMSRSSDAIWPGGYLGAYIRWQLVRASAEERSTAWQQWLQTLDLTTGWLWDALMEPLLTAVLPAGTPGSASVEDSSKAAEIILIPDSFLGLLPLHAASRQDDAAPGGKRFALEMAMFRYAPNVRTLIAGRALSKTLAHEHLLLFVDPQPSAANPLPSAAAEANAILACWKQAVVTDRWRAGATREALDVLLPEHSVFHFIGHAFASNWKAPERGGLLLSDNRMLTVGDLSHMRIGLRLAILSACETGIPGLELPDELIGLPSALVEAGVAGVVASLWAVADRSTARLMSEFHRLWRHEGVAPVQALHRAQLHLRRSEEYRHPHYWAAFAYTGV